MRIKNEKREKVKFIIFPKKCLKCKDWICLEKMLVTYDPIPLSVPSFHKTYYCKECM
ncbi:MAG: hypothetical protein ACOC1K_05540 [Nanoarchaeota archaeon]